MRPTKLCRSVFLGLCAAVPLWTASPIFGQVGAQFGAPAVQHTTVLNLPSPFAQALAVAAGGDEAVAQWYQSRDYTPFWSTAEAALRRAALLEALSYAPDHGLPASRYNINALQMALSSARSETDLAQIEVLFSQTYLKYARDLSSGLLEPHKIESTIVREITRKDPQDLLSAMAYGDPRAVLADLLPKSTQYAQLQKAKFDLERQIALGGWGAPIPGKLGPDAQGSAVVALRERLIAMGYLPPTASAVYDAEIEEAVTRFQKAHGLATDGVVQGATLTQLNVPASERLKSVLVALERERWMDIDRSGRMIWVNLPDFTARIMDDGQEVFRTRSVIGREDADRRTPEFSDRMNHLVINPSWTVPRSITVKEYLPNMQRNSNANSYLQVIDSKGRVVPRNQVNFNAYTARSFPYVLRQPPSAGNSLGLVKFMFPNKYNIYLHDTPSKSLFGHDKRAYSHGCIRLADPFDFAYVLLAAQTADPQAEFNRYLQSGKESRVDLVNPVPVHLVYFTAYPEADGQISYRNDVYDRDAKLWTALADAGVALPLYSQ